MTVSTEQHNATKKPQNYVSAIQRNIVIAVLNIVEFVIHEGKVLKFYFASPAGFSWAIFITDGSPCLRDFYFKSDICQASEA